MLVHPEVTLDDIDQAIRQFPVGHRSGRVFFGVDERALLETEKDYVLYGSEYQRVVCKRILGDGKDYS